MVSVIILFEIVYWNYRLILRLRSSNDDHNDNESNNNVEGDYGHNNSDMVIINNGHTIVNDELPPYDGLRMSIDERIDNAALSPTSIIQIFDNDTNNSLSIIQIPDINNSIQIHDIMLNCFNQKCRVCAATYSGIGKTSTGTLKNHIKTKHPNEYQRCVQTTLNFQRINPYPPKENFMKTKVMINWIIMNMQPFSIVEDNFFIEMIKKFDPPYQMPCCKYIKNQIELIDVLSPFYSATLLFSSSNYSTIGEFHFTLWTLVKNLHKQIKVSNAQYIVANSILYKLEQYFKLPDEAKMIASLLDPYTKCSTFTTDEITRTVTAIKCKLIHYNSSFNINNNNTSTITTNNQTSPSQTIKNRIDACAHIRSLASQFLPTNNTHTNDEVEKYLLLAKENECNPLMWWCTHKETFPSLSELAKDYLAIQSTSVPCEQSFSVAGLTISKLRNHLDPETSRGLLCLKSWTSEKNWTRI
ncbi:4950_t:CDS:2 [Entrophospora sp. SA101]|nr:4950_t:CDS:2 [Entrophospora sp. SA101]